MSDENMRRFSFEGNTLEQIHDWMRTGAGLGGLTPAIQALHDLSKELDYSVESLQTALKKIGVGWEGVAADGADGSVRDGQTWGVEATPTVSGSALTTDDVASSFSTTQSRMPTPAEAELSSGERSRLSAVPILGPMLDRHLADEKLDRVTNEARQRMSDWQDGAQSLVDAVRPLPVVPQPVVEAAASSTGSGTSSGGPGLTGVAGVPAAPSAPGQPAGLVPGTGGSIPGGVATPPPAGSGVPPSGRLVGSLPQPSALLPPVAPVQPPGRAPAGGLPLVPFAVGGVGSDETAGRRRAYGPGVFNAEEIARARGGSGMGGGAAGAVRGGVLGGAAEGGATGRGAAGTAAAPDAEEHARGRGVAGAAARAGTSSIMQPAVGGAHGEGEDAEHTDKYADKSDEYFAGDVHRVAPPVIGG